MRKKTISSVIVTIIILSAVFMVGCSNESMPSNLVIINNTNVSFKSIGFYQEKSSGGVYNADGSLIKPGQEFKLNLENNTFRLSITDENNNEFKSPELNIDLESSSDKYKISIETGVSGDLEFILCD